MPEQPTLQARADRRFVSELVVGERVESTFLLTRCDLRTTRGGDHYLALELADRTGKIGGRMWDNAEAIARKANAGDYVHVDGVVDTWQSTPQIKVDRMRAADPSEVDPADFLPSSDRDPDEMLQELRDVVGTVRNTHLRRLLEEVFGDPEVSARFQRAPGGVRLHHAWVGGLLEHTLSVIGLAEGVAAHYPGLDRDLLVAGACLHDLGKIWELSYETAFEYTDEGRLVGHLLLETSWLARKIDGIEGFPPALRTHLLHLLASHHGKQEHGAPLEPATPEALALHYIDDLDSKMAAMVAAIAEARSTGSPTAWSPSLGRRVVGRSWDEGED